MAQALGLNRPVPDFPAPSLQSERDAGSQPRGSERALLHLQRAAARGGRVVFLVEQVVDVQLQTGLVVMGG